MWEHILANAAANRLCCVGAVACAPAAAKKACKNCTCGRAEAEAEGKPAAPVKLTQDMLDNPTTNCGSVGAPPSPLPPFPCFADP